MFSLYVYLYNISSYNNSSEGFRQSSNSIERYTVKEDVGLNKNGINMGYVTCKVVVEYSSLGPSYTVISATCEPHFSIAYPFLTIGGVKSDPAVGKKITGDSVKVSFNVREMTSGTMWSYDCRIRI